MEASVMVTRAEGFGRTLRGDRWWVAPLSVAVGLAVCGAYATWAIFQGRHYFSDPYLSPFYSPCLGAQCPDAVRLLEFGWWPFSPAILLMWIILGFRGTCYYYRKAYYRAYFLDPAACAVGEHRGHRYKGETSFPFVLQNLHRYFLYLSAIILAFLWYDTLRAFLFEDGFGLGVGTILLLVNVVLLTGYTFGCHSLRHLVGGSVDCYSCARFGGARHGLWRGASFFNRNHMAWAWTSLIFVCLTDLYIRLVAAGVITDFRIL
ncbi:MAG: succinate dehydrogenase [Gemmatimonadetes bacterium]|nr:succinate dehydrogenase [Gemmatimonadota bacterium]